MGIFRHGYGHGMTLSGCTPGQKKQRTYSEVDTLVSTGSKSVDFVDFVVGKLSFFRCGEPF